MNYITELQNVISKLHGCESIYLETVSVKETFQSQTVWEGDVEVFNIRGHPKAKKCYAWAHASGNEGRGKRYVAVLQIPPVDSPQNAVRAAIVDEVKEAMPKKKTNKLGRPRMPKSKVKGTVLQIRLSESEKVGYEVLATKEGLTLSEWARQTLKNAEQ